MYPETYQLTTVIVSAPGKRPAECMRSSKMPNVLFASDMSIAEFRMGWPPTSEEMLNIFLLPAVQ